MEKDLCECGRQSREHDEKTPILREGETVCLRFRLDRKATWHAQKGQPRARGRRILAMSVCSACKSTQGPFEYVDGHMRHRGCPGPRATPAPAKPTATTTLQRLAASMGLELR